MKNEEARRAVLSEWHTWAAETGAKGTANEAMLFYQHLAKQRPHLLEFSRAEARRAVSESLIRWRKPEPPIEIIE